MSNQDFAYSLPIYVLGPVAERLHAIDATLGQSPNQHSKSSVEVKLAN